jgi:hypothetical protein
MPGPKERTSKHHIAVVFRSVDLAETKALSEYLTSKGIENVLDPTTPVSQITVTRRARNKALKAIARAHMLKALQTETPIKRYIFGLGTLTGSPFWILYYTLGKLDRNFTGQLQYSPKSEIYFLAAVGAAILAIALLAAFLAK